MAGVAAWQRDRRVHWWMVFLGGGRMWRCECRVQGHSWGVEFGSMIEGCKGKLYTRGVCVGGGGFIGGGWDLAV